MPAEPHGQQQKIGRLEGGGGRAPQGIHPTSKDTQTKKFSPNLILLNSSKLIPNKSPNTPTSNPGFAVYKFTFGFK